MNCTVNRLLQTAYSTIGTWETNGILKYYSMEPANPIPAGTYEADIYFSPKHGYKVPMLKNVPGHNFIEIHVGNFPKDTEDCTLLGSANLGINYIGSSQVAIDDFYPQFFAARAKNEKVFITYIDFFKQASSKPL